VQIGEDKVFLPASIADQLDDEREARELAPTRAEPAPEPDPAPEPEDIADQRSPLELDISQIKDSGDAAALVEFIEQELDGYDARVNQQVKEIFRHATGKVT
jgi:hypothetical protein